MFLSCGLGKNIRYAQKHRAFFKALLQDKQYYPWSIRDKMEDLNKQMRSIQIPHGREEPPRSLHERAKWKGTVVKLNLEVLITHSCGMAIGMLVYFNTFGGRAPAQQVPRSLEVTGGGFASDVLFLHCSIRFESNSCQPSIVRNPVSDALWGQV